MAGGNVTVTVTAGATFTITCAADASPEINSITWFKDGVQISIPSGRYSGGTPSTPDLTVTNVVKEDSGAYVCSASNGIGTANGSVNTLIIRCKYRTILRVLFVCTCDGFCRVCRDGYQWLLRIQSTQYNFLFVKLYFYLI